MWAPIESETAMLLATVSLTPSTSDLPGGAALQSLADGIAAWALIGALVALLLEKETVDGSDVYRMAGRLGDLPGRLKT